MPRHIPVLLNEVVDSLQLKKGMKVVDATLGDAGHAEKILETIGPTGKLLGIDADSESIGRAKNFLAKFDQQVVFVQNNFAHLKESIEAHKFFPVDALLVDLGWSSPQFKERKRGFSFEGSEPLDMRYDPTSQRITAADIVNTTSVKDLEGIFRKYGEEKLSREIAQTILFKRKDKLFSNTEELVNVVLEVYRQKLRSAKKIPWVGGIHPATKVFQALRLVVNQELEVLERALPQMIEMLRPGGRLAIITFHSLEDRIVKHYFKTIEYTLVKLVNKKPITPSREELELNPRSRSAKLRVVEKI